MKSLKAEWFAWPEVAKLRDAFSRHEDALRFVGGCVRDSLLGLPVKDIDMATSLSPQEVVELGEQAGLKMLPTGLKHGTVTAVMGGRSFEITTLRRDTLCDGRHALVEFTDDWKEDAMRRDFTMNALYLGMDGMLHDYTRGVEDAQAGRIRFIGDASQRICEDYLRILRYFRFYAYYAKQSADEAALAACEAGKEGLDALSGERIQAEMFKLLAAPKAAEALALMQQTGVLEKLTGPPQLARFETLLALQDAAATQPVLFTKLAALLLPGAHMDVAPRWKLSNEAKSKLAMFDSQLLAISDDPSEAEQKRLLRKLGKEDFQQLVLMGWADAGQPAGKPYHNMLALAENWEIPTFPIGGEDLKALGIAEGEKLGKTLRELETLWEESDYQLSKKELLEKIAAN